MTRAKRSSATPVAVDLQIAVADAGVPAAASFERWVGAALDGRDARRQLVVRVVGEDESRDLNRRFRHKDKPTNVLSFPFDPVPGIEEAYLGDLVICAPIVAREAADQHKAGDAHWAHLVVHGVLHLLGYDHADGEQARIMEALEIGILGRLGYLDPYQ